MNEIDDDVRHIVEKWRAWGEEDKRAVVQPLRDGSIDRRAILGFMLTLCLALALFAMLEAGMVPSR